MVCKQFTAGWLLVDSANILLTEHRPLEQLGGMPQPHKRPPPQPRLYELIEMRKQKGFGQAYFAKQLGVTRLHLTAIEMGRRRPSLELAIRWLVLLAPEARLRMFGDLPIIERRLRLLLEMQKVSPQTIAA